MASLWKGFKSLQLFSKQLTQGLNSINVPNGCRSKTFAAPRKRIPDWLPKPERQPYKESLTPTNQAFIQDYIKTLQEESPLKDVQPIQTVAKASSRRAGLIAKKIGVYPMWLKNGDRVQSTLLQVIDNEVVKYIPPEEFNPMVPPKRKNKRFGYLIVGAENIDPQLLTKKYYGIFAKAGVTPKKYLARFVVSPDAALQTGTRLDVNHFQPGDVLDIRAKTIGRGFQGVMKRWGFKGQPASHGQTKTHRRPGNIGSGSSRARVVPGTKMPGHMGHRWRVHRGIRILRINPQYNVIWVLGQNIPGEVNSYCYLYDTILPRRKTMKTRFPTYLPETDENPVNNFYADDVHNFEDPTITFKPES